MKKQNGYRLIVIGASAGGFKAVIQCLGGFKQRADAAFFVVIHSVSDAPETMAKHMEKMTEMPVSYAEDGQEIIAGTVILARPGQHLMTKNNRVLLTNGPKENLFRPSIDVLFRSAAVNYGHRVIGVLLTGRLNDGTMGLSAIKRCGGRTVIQDPASAEYADMPLLAQKTVDPDFIMLPEGMENLLNRLVDEPAPPKKEIPAALQKEFEITSHIGSLINGERDEEGETNFSCPACGGPLRLMENEDVTHYRCRTGHSYTLASLDEEQAQVLEESLWVALRILDERLNLLKKMIKDYERKGLDMLAKSNQHKLEEVERHAEHLKRLMGLNE